MNHNGLSLAEVFQLRGKAFAEISEYAFAIDAIAAALGDLDVAMTSCIDDRNIDDQQTLVTTARRLAAILDGVQA